MDRIKEIEADPLLNVREAAVELNISEDWLNKLRSRGGGPKFIRLGRSVRYRRSHLHEFAEENTRRSTADTGRAA